MFNPIFTGHLIRLAAPLPKTLDPRPCGPVTTATCAMWTTIRCDRMRPIRTAWARATTSTSATVRTRQDDTLIGFIALFEPQVAQPDG